MKKKFLKSLKKILENIFLSCILEGFPKEDTKPRIYKRLTDFSVQKL